MEGAQRHRRRRSAAASDRGRQVRRDRHQSRRAHRGPAERPRRPNSFLNQGRASGPPLSQERAMHELIEIFKSWAVNVADNTPPGVDVRPTWEDVEGLMA